MEIIFKGRQTDVPARFRKHAAAKLNKLEKLDQKAIRVDVEVSVERNPRQASQKERVELTVRSRGPAIRAEAAAEDRFAALDLALAKLDSRLRRALDRRKNHHGGHGPVRLVGLPDGEPPAGQEDLVPHEQQAPEPAADWPADSAPALPGDSSSDDVVPIEMEGDGPLVVRQKFHQAHPMTIDQALLEMELVGHDFYLFHDINCTMPSVVYRRRGYQYGVIRLMDNAGGDSEPRSAPIARGGARQRGDRAPDPAVNGQPGHDARGETAAMLKSG
jgi:ribosomal subunit interface protein